MPLGTFQYTFTKKVWHQIICLAILCLNCVHILGPDIDLIYCSCLVAIANARAISDHCNFSWSGHHFVGLVDNDIFPHASVVWRYILVHELSVLAEATFWMQQFTKVPYSSAAAKHVNILVWARHDLILCMIVNSLNNLVSVKGIQVRLSTFVYIHAKWKSRNVVIKSY